MNLGFTLLPSSAQTDVIEMQMSVDEEIEAEQHSQWTRFYRAMGVFVNAFKELQQNNVEELAAFQKLSQPCMKRKFNSDTNEAMNEYHSIIEARKQQQKIWKDKWHATVAFMKLQMHGDIDNTVETEQASVIPINVVRCESCKRQPCTQPHVADSVLLGQ